MSATTNSNARPSGAKWAWLAAYLATLVAIVLGMLTLRRMTLRDMDTPEARARWQAWRDAPPNQDTGGPVRRRPPSSAEPPALVLMRDYFGVMFAGALLFGSLLFAAIAMAARGALAGHDVASMDERSRKAR